MGKTSPTESSRRPYLRACLALSLVALLAGGLTLIGRQPRNAGPARVGTTADSYRLTSLDQIKSQAPSPRPLNIQRWTTASGTRVLFAEAHELPMMDLQLTFAAGSSRDGDSPGLALLTNALFNEGVPGQDARAIARGFESLGAEFTNGAYRDMALLSLRSLSAEEKREPALALFCQVIGQPSFPQEALQRVRNQLLASLEEQQQDPAALAQKELFGRLYGQHPYGHFGGGTAKSLAAIDRRQLQAFRKSAYTSGNAILALVGDLSRSQAQTLADQVSAALPRGPALPPLPEPSAPQPGQFAISYPSTQTHLILAQLGIAYGDADLPALTLGNQILGGGGFGTRLMTEVREKRGLSYGISSKFSPMARRGPFTIGVDTRAPMGQATLDLVREQVRRFLAEGPSEKELEDAKRELLGSFPLSTASNAEILEQLGAMAFYHLPASYLEDQMKAIQAVTLPQVKAAMGRHLDPAAWVMVSVGPEVQQQPLPPPGAGPDQPSDGPPEHGGAPQ